MTNVSDTLTLLTDLLREHDTRLAERGRGYVDRVEGLSWDAVAGMARCLVRGTGPTPYCVTVQGIGAAGSRLPRTDGGHDARCDCPFAEGGPVPLQTHLRGGLPADPTGRGRFQSW